MQESLELFEQIPKELREPVAKLLDGLESRLRSEFSVTRQDFSELKNIVNTLAQAHKQSEDRLSRLETLVEDLVQAQKRTDERFEELAQAQKRTEDRLDRLEKVVEELAQAQKRTEDRLDRVEAAIERLTLVQERFERTFESKIGALGRRWGLSTESAFREAMRGILGGMGFQVERYHNYDASGEVYGWPDQVELDIVIQNGILIVIEIKASMSKSEVATFHRKLRFYEEQEEKTVNRRLIVSPFVDSSAVQKALDLGMEVFTDINSLQ